jgi:site-specific DNA-adenine methylase
VWSALGDVDSYTEPFAGSLAVLLARPSWHKGQTETINDRDEFVANFWRALSYDPEQVAHYADWPVNETDLFARHLWLVNEGKRLMQQGMEQDPEWYDAKIAGWWLWGVCSWIGSGWCSGTGPHTYESIGAGCPLGAVDDGNAGQGVNRQLPYLGNAGQGVNRQLPHLGNAGQGVNRQLPSINVHGKGITNKTNSGDIYAYMHALAARLRNVRVCCGDWARIVTNGALNYGSTVGIFLDPPYSDLAERTSNLYAVDDLDVAHEVRAWCIANGDNLRYRICLAGYKDEHDGEMPSSWRQMAWKANKSYGRSTSAGSINDVNRHKEMLWFSPACLHEKPTLFEQPMEEEEEAA